MIRIKKPKDAPEAKPGGFGWKLFASFFGIGLSPFAPGSAASFVAFVILWFIPIKNLTFHPGYWVGFIAVSFFGVLVSSKAEKYWGHDPSKIVIDEVAGCMVSVMFLPKNIWLWLIAFIAFRAYDILKLPPAKTAENKLPGGWGVMTDDIIAGIYAFLLAQIVRFAFPQIGG
jgi:phosphatidylglycerophosphatase A